MSTVHVLVVISMGRLGGFLTGLAGFFADPNPPIFVSDLQDVNNFCFSKFYCLLLFECILRHFSKMKSHKVTKQ
jgi:hypothetical protein